MRIAYTTMTLSYLAEYNIWFTSEVIVNQNIDKDYEYAYVHAEIRCVPQTNNISIKLSFLVCACLCMFDQVLHKR